MICPIAELDLCGMAITFDSEDEMLECDHKALLQFFSVMYAVVLISECADEITTCDQTESY